MVFLILHFPRWHMQIAPTAGNMAVMRLAIIFLLFSAGYLTSGFCGVSTSDPLWDWKYDAIERLSIALGERAVTNTRPFSRLEMARQTIALSKKAKISGKNGWYFKGLLARLERGLEEEIAEIEKGAIKGFKARPLRWVRLKTVIGDGPIKLENDYGFRADKTSSRLELSTSGRWNNIGYELRPQYNYLSGSGEDGGYGAGIHSGYMVAWLGNTEIEIGKDAMWWGPGRYGSWLMTDNAPAFELIKISNAQSGVFPWLLKYLGATRFTAFLGRISKQTVEYKNGDASAFVEISENASPYMAGTRLDFSPSAFLELAASTTSVFISRKGDNFSLEDIGQVILPTDSANKEEAYKGPVASRIASVEATLKAGGERAFMKFLGLEGLKLYAEYGGEDIRLSPNSFQLEDQATQYGLYLDTGTADLLIEYADNYSSARHRWYGHYQFQDGYRNEGFVLGHNMGNCNSQKYRCNSRDIFIKLSFPFKENLKTSVYHDRRKINPAPDETFAGNYTGVSLEAFTKSYGLLKLSYEYRQGYNAATNNLLALEVFYDY